MTGDPLDPDSDRTLDEGDSDLGQQLAQQRVVRAAEPRDDGIRPAIRPAAQAGSSSLPRARPASASPVSSPPSPPVLPLPPAPTRGRGGGGIVVHRASEAPPPPPAAPPVVEALQALKPAAAAARSSPPTSSVSSLKPDVAEALAGLKPAAKTAASLTSLPPSALPPGRVSSKVTAPPMSMSSDGADASTSTSTATATPLVRSITIPRWALQGAALVVLTCVTIGIGFSVRPDQDVSALPPVVALPELPITALHCDTLRAVDRTLECAFSPAMLASMTEGERTKRLQSTKKSALAMGYTRVVLVDRTGTWRALRTDDAPVATMATALAEASKTPAPSSSTSSTSRPSRPSRSSRLSRPSNPSRASGSRTTAPATNATPPK